MSEFYEKKLYVIPKRSSIQLLSVQCYLTSVIEQELVIN